MPTRNAWLAASLLFVACAASAEGAPRTTAGSADAVTPAEIVAGARLKSSGLMATQPAPMAPRLDNAATAEAEAPMAWRPAELGLAALAIVAFIAMRLRR